MAQRGELVRPQAEDLGVELLPVVPAGVEDPALVVDLLPELVLEERDALRREEMEIAPHPPPGEEVPGIDPAGPLGGAQTAAQRPADLPRLAAALPVRITEPPQLQPDIADAALVAAVLEQVPLHRAGGAAERIEALRREIRVEQEGEENLQCLRLAASIFTAQDEASVLEAEFLLVVLPEIEDAGPQRLEALARGGGKSGGGRRRQSQRDGRWSVPPPDLTPPAPLSHRPPFHRERGELRLLALVGAFVQERAGRGRPSPGRRGGDGRGVGGEVGWGKRAIPAQLIHRSRPCCPCRPLGPGAAPSPQIEQSPAAQ